MTTVAKRAARVFDAVLRHPVVVPVGAVVLALLIGAVIIIAAGLYIFLREQRLGKAQAVVPPAA